MALTGSNSDPSLQLLNQPAISRANNAAIKNPTNLPFATESPKANQKMLNFNEHRKPKSN